MRDHYVTGSYIARDYKLSLFKSARNTKCAVIHHSCEGFGRPSDNV